MPIFEYKVFDESGNLSEGHIESHNIQAARQKLRQQKYYIKSLKEDSAKRDRQLFPFLAKLLYRIPRKDIGLFVKQLGTLLGAGITIDDAMQGVWEQTENEHLKKIIVEMRQALVSGKSLSDSFAEHKEIFPPVYENMVRVGEATGNYEAVLNRLSELEEKNEDLKSKTITAMIYPGIMFLLSISVVLFLLTSVVPQIEVLFKNFKAELPLPTQIVLGLSSLVKNTWHFFLLATPFVYYFFQKWKSTSKGKLKWDTLKLKMPFFGSLFRKIEVSRFTRNFGTLLDSNVPLLSALEIINGTVENEIFRLEIEKAIEQIKEGDNLKDSLKSSVILPHLVKGMMAAGESSDRLSEMLLKSSDVLEAEVDTVVKRLTTALEPVMIIFMGLAVGGIMASVMMPLFKMSELIK